MRLEKRLERIERSVERAAGCPACRGIRFSRWDEPVDLSPCPTCGSRPLLLTIDLKGEHSGDRTAAEQA